MKVIAPNLPGNLSIFQAWTDLLLDILRVDVNLIHNLYFDAALTQVGTYVHSIHRLFKWEHMRHQRLQIQQFALHGCNTSRPSIGIPVNELEVDLFVRQRTSKSQRDKKVAMQANLPHQDSNA